MSPPLWFKILFEENLSGLIDDKEETYVIFYILINHTFQAMIESRLYFISTKHKSKSYFFPKKGEIRRMNVITNFHVYDLEETIVSSGYAMIEEYNEELCIEQATALKEALSSDNRHYTRVLKLLKAPLNSGHCSFAKGIVVNMDITFTNKAWIEFQRYHFADIITGMSTMHRISKFDLEEAFNEYTDPAIIQRLKELQQTYTETKSKDDYLKLLYSTPAGLKMTGRITTNYLQLMNIWSQRHTHRLPEWRQFCDELIEKLPLFKEFLIANGQLKDL